MNYRLLLWKDVGVEDNIYFSNTCEQIAWVSPINLVGKKNKHSIETNMKQIQIQIFYDEKKTFNNDWKR
jgi:hypothetical protein